jgi:hypothetical protein
MDSLFEGENMTRNIFATVGLCSLLAMEFLPTTVHAHPEESRVSIEKDEDVSVQAGAVTVGFQLIDFKQHKTLSDPDLTILHEKKLHCFFFDPALQEFHHEHAEFVNNEWRVSVTLPVNGEYWFWTQGKITADGEEFTASARVKVMGGKVANPLPPVLGNVRMGSDGQTQVILSNAPVIANQMGMLMLQVTHADGSQPSLAPYLGEVAHVVAVSDDGDSLMHVHPEGQPGQTEMMLHTMFTRAGEYRLWVQLVDGGSLKTIPLSVAVQPASPKKKTVR